MSDVGNCAPPADGADRACVLCGEPRVTVEAAADAYDLLRCARCQLSFAHPIAPPPRLYDAAYEADGTYGAYARAQVAKIKAGRVRSGWAQRRFFNLARTPGRLLDVGCGSGAFMVAAQRHGWRVSGVEMSRTAAALARQQLGLDVRVGTIADVVAGDGFDAVTAWEVIEHLADPLRFLRAVHGALAPGGVVALSTPDWESRWPRSTWTGLAASLPPIHVTFWSQHALRWALAHAEFTDIDIRRKPWASLYELGGRYQLKHIAAVLLHGFVRREGGGQLFAHAARRL